MKYLVKFLPILMVTAWLLGCSSQAKVVGDHTHKIESAIIVIPGYYGTRLVTEADDNLIFISLSQALFGDQALTLPLPGFGLKGTTNLKPDALLDEVPIIPPFYSIDIYGSLLNKLHLSNKKNQEVISFAYDWRRDLLETVQSLDVLIRKLQTEGKKDISVVAHSMGGLIVSYYLRYGTQDIDSAIETWEGTESLKNVVLAGVPFLGAMHSFRNMNFGVTVGLNSSLLSAEAYASFPASYYTLPIADSDELLSPKLEPVKDMIRNSKLWQQYGWGLLNTNQLFSNEIIEQRAAYTSFWLDRSQRFLELLRTPQSTASPKQSRLLYLYAKGTPTLSKGVWSGAQAKGPDSLIFEDPNSTASGFVTTSTTVYADGDGTVTVSSAFLPPAYRRTLPTTIREYEVGHTELVQHPGIQNDIATFLENPN